MSNTNSIGAFIAALRKANGLTQKQLAEKLNVSDKAVSRWERDECAPDLSLIPVIAEIFGVTSDELLRGQRAAPDAAPTPQAEEKAKKRLQYLLDKLTTRYKIQSVISISIAVVGLIAAMILNAFNRAQAGFLVGCVFLLAATVCQIIFLTLCRSELRSGEFDEEAVTACRNSIIRGAEWVFSIIAALLFAAAPLALADDPYWGVAVPYWWTTGLAFVSIPAILCPILCIILNYKLGVFRPLGPKGKLRLKSALILIPILLVTFVVQDILANVLRAYPNVLCQGTKCATFEEFKEIIEKPLSHSGEELEFVEERTTTSGHGIRIYRDSEGTEYTAYHYDHEWKLGVPGEAYYEANKTIRDISYDGKYWYLYDGQQYTSYQNRYNAIHVVILILYPVEILAAILICRKKEKNLV